MKKFVMLALALALSNQLNADCPDTDLVCNYLTWFNNNTEYHYTYVGTVNNIGCCYDWRKATCNPCDNIDQKCREAFPEACGAGQCDGNNQASCDLDKKENSHKKL